MTSSLSPRTTDLRPVRFAVHQESSNRHLSMPENNNGFDHSSLKTYRFLKDYVYRESGIVLDDDKHYLVESRLMPVASQEHFPSLDALCTALRSNDQSASPKKKKSSRP